jgi:hypothetical protein
VVLVRGERLLIRELKTARGKLSQAQEMWIGALAAAGVNVGVWRPGDWAVIEAELR